MKINLLSIIATAVSALTLATAAQSQSQSKPVGDDSTAASPKVSQMFAERHASVSTATAATPAMACAKCAEVQTTKVSPQAKGAETMTGAKQVSYAHGCPSCQTKLTLAGEGKAKHSLANHQCAMAVASTPACCATK